MNSGDPGNDLGNDPGKLSGADAASKHPERAIALRYEAGRDAAPRVVASGRGSVAEVIIQRAREANVPIREDETLIAALAPLSVGAQIPPALYRAVAELLLWIYQIDSRL